MDILSFGDLHWGTDCDEDVCAAADKILIKADVIRPTLIVITGDIYDASSDPDNRDIATDYIIQFANRAPVVIVKGNHDARKELSIMAKLKAEFPITVYERPGCMAFPVQDPCVFAHFLPWFTKAGWVAGQIGSDLGIKAGNEAVSLLALSYLKACVAKYGPGTHLLFGHLMIEGSKAENHQALLGEGITFGYHDLVEAGFSGGAFGHIHLAQSFGDRDQGAAEFRYNGAIAALDYGESARNKGFSVLDTETLEFKTFQLNSIVRVTLDATWGMELTWQGDIAEATPGARVRVKLMIEEGFSSEDGENAVKAVFANLNPPLLDLKIEKQRKPRDQVRAAEIAAAQTAPQKLEAYWKATEAIPEEPMRSDMLALTKELEEECLLKQGGV